jgi:putative addiction module component (TIGR02574 family)
MDYAAVLNAVKSLPWDEQVRLFQELGDQLGADNSGFDELDEETKRQLDERIADMQVNPNDTVPWEEVYAAAKTRLRK